jgi:hypothetical protein
VCLATQATSRSLDREQDFPLSTLHLPLSASRAAAGTPAHTPTARTRVKFTFSTYLDHRSAWPRRREGLYCSAWLFQWCRSDRGPGNFGRFLRSQPS